MALGNCFQTRGEAEVKRREILDTMAPWAVINWKPRPRTKEYPGDSYYYVGGSGEIFTNVFTGCDHDKVRMAFGNCFSTKVEAQIKKFEILGDA